MKCSVAAVIVGPTIEESVPVFAFAHECYGTTLEDWLPEGSEVGGVESDRACFEVDGFDEDDVGFDLCVNPDRRMPFQTEARCDGRS